jgi:hypothetical protein
VELKEQSSQKFVKPTFESPGTESCPRQQISQNHPAEICESRSPLAAKLRKPDRAGSATLPGFWDRTKNGLSQHCISQARPEMNSRVHQTEYRYKLKVWMHKTPPVSLTDLTHFLQPRREYELAVALSVPSAFRGQDVAG